MKVIVIGAGPAGMMAAINAATNGAKVTIIEKMNMIGKKLLITGKGRCNVTNASDISEFIPNTPGNGMFLYSSFSQYTNADVINFFESEGVKLKEERGKRIFPVSDKSLDIVRALERKLKKLNVEIKLNTKVEKIILKSNSSDLEVEGIKTNKGEIIKADKIILATGGKSYPATGSTGDGYKLAKELGHTITEIKPSLVPLECYEQYAKQMQGLALKNVNIKFIDTTKSKCIYEDFGEMLFTHFGVSGPIILSASAHLLRYKNIQNLMNDKKMKLSIDLKPALSEEKLDLRLRRDFEKYTNKEIKNALFDILPKMIIPIIIKLSNIDEDKKVHQITKEERLVLLKLIKEFPVTVKGFRPIEEAIITAGGINIKEINSSTMESKIIKNLYFAGEIIDVDAYTGGYNLQIAFSTGYVAGENK